MDFGGLESLAFTLSARCSFDLQLYFLKLYRPCRKAAPTGTAVRYSFLRNANTSLFQSPPIQHFEFCMKVPSRCFGRIEINLSTKCLVVVQTGVYGLLSILSCKHIISIYGEFFSLLLLNNQLILQASPQL